MANLSSLVHELRERIAASSSSPSHPGDGPDPLESRFRAVLPNLLQAYVLPSSTGLSLSIYLSISLFPCVFCLNYHLLLIIYVLACSQWKRSDGSTQAPRSHCQEFPWSSLPWKGERRPTRHRPNFALFRRTHVPVSAYFRTLFCFFVLFSHRLMEWHCFCSSMTLEGRGFSGVVRCDLLMGGSSFYLNLGFGVCLDLGILA